MQTNTNLLQRPPDPAAPTVATDLEGTLTSGVTVWGMHDYLVKIGREREARRFRNIRLPGFVLRRALGFDMRKYKNDWMRDLLRLYGGMPLEDFAAMGEWVVENRLWETRRQHVIRELQEHLAAGRRIVIVTGMFEPLLEALLRRLPGFEAIGTPLVIENGIFTGEMETDFNVGERKRMQLSAFAGEGGQIHGAYGDTFADRFMLGMSAHPVAVHPDKGLRQLAETEGWRVLEE